MVNKNLYRAALASAGKTQESLAKEIGIAPSTLIHGISTGKIRIEIANKIIKSLNITNPAEIFFGNEDT